MVTVRAIHGVIERVESASSTLAMLAERHPEAARLATAIINRDLNSALDDLTYLKSVASD